MKKETEIIALMRGIRTHRQHNTQKMKRLLAQSYKLDADVTSMRLEIEKLSLEMKTVSLLEETLNAIIREAQSKEAKKK